MNEKMKILKLLEEGKITPEEAARLLSALGEGKKNDVSSSFVKTIMDGISSIVTGAVGGAFSFAGSGEKEIKLEKGDEIVLKSVGSSLKFSTQKADIFNVESDSGLIKTIKEDKKLTAKIIGGNAEILFPEASFITVKDVGGNIEGKVTKMFKLKQIGGSARLKFDKIDNVEIESKTGSITLFFGEKCNASFDIFAHNGNINFELPAAEFEINKNDRVKGKIGNGKGNIIVNVVSGDVSILSLR